MIPETFCLVPAVDMQAIADYYYIDKQLKKKQDELPIVPLRGWAWTLNYDQQQHG